MADKKKRLSLETRHGLKAHLFLLPFYIGFIVFFLQPILESFLMTFQDIVFNENGYDTRFVGLENLKYIFTKEPNFTEALVNSITEFIWKVPVILISSMFFAMLINKPFRGRTFVRAVFFLPVIVASGLAITIVQGDTVAGSVLTGDTVSGGAISQSTALKDILVQFGLNDKLISGITTVTDSMFSTVWQTGIQTIIFLAGLQGISPALYEASAVEGASSWDNFLFITVPQLIPMMLVNIIYSVIDYLTNPSNSVMKMVLSNSGMNRLGWASAIAWSYFLMVTVILGIILLVFFGATRKKL